MMQKKNLFIALWLFCTSTAFAQTINHGRASTENTIAWFNYTGDHKIAKKWSLHTEYQFRRADFLATWEQSLLRLAVNYHFTDQVMFTVGYGLIHTFSYGTDPIVRRTKSGADQVFPEHRLYQDLFIKNNSGIFEINHRFRFEERWLANMYDNQNNLRDDAWKFTLRMRYRVRFALPLKGKTIDDNEFYLHAFDEIFIGFGNDVGANIFDQNRINVGLGYRFTKDIRVEAGFLSQIVQKPSNLLVKDVTNPLITKSYPYFEYNSGLLLALTYNVDFSKKAPVAPLQP
jgi:hypothetical protein